MTLGELKEQLDGISDDACVYLKVGPDVEWLAMVARLRKGRIDEDQNVDDVVVISNEI